MFSYLYSFISPTTINTKSNETTPVERSETTPVERSETNFLPIVETIQVEEDVLPRVRTPEETIIHEPLNILDTHFVSSIPTQTINTGNPEYIVINNDNLSLEIPEEEQSISNFSDSIVQDHFTLHTPENNNKPVDYNMNYDYFIENLVIETKDITVLPVETVAVLPVENTVIETKVEIQDQEIVREIKPIQTQEKISNDVQYITIFADENSFGFHRATILKSMNKFLSSKKQSNFLVNLISYTNQYNHIINNQHISTISNIDLKPIKSRSNCSNELDKMLGCYLPQNSTKENSLLIMINNDKKLKTESESCKIVHITSYQETDWKIY